MKLIKIFLTVAVLSLTFIIYPLLDHWSLIPHKIFTSSDFDIKEYFSSCDYDNDTVDDAHDIMLGARKYISSGLKYKSGYYSGGYPTDEYSVCTDVIWNAFNEAGYNLKELIDDDISKNTEHYPLTTPDPNIDFRRVKNLKVFFERFALSLTTDISDIKEWQPGDIVIFAPSHIGIISDKRNMDGIPYLIHHSGQPVKEEDAIVKRNMSIVGHYRWR